MNAIMSPRDIPVLLICFNRPEKLDEVVKSLDGVKPMSLFIHFDGPRNSNDEKLISDGLKVIDNIPWSSRKEICIQDKNLGCGKGVFAAVSWFFSKVEYGLILEDDVVVNPNFFEVLCWYFSSEISFQLAGISGFNRVPKDMLSEVNTIFYRSIYVQSLAWGTRRELWQNFALDDEIWKEGFNSVVLSSLGNKAFRRYWQNLLKKEILTGQLDTWDVQWQAYNWALDRKFAITTENFAKHIGFGASATHTKSEVVPRWHPLFSEATDFDNKYTLPVLEIDKRADKWSNNHFYPITYKSRLHLMLSKSKNWFRKIFWRMRKET